MSAPEDTTPVVAGPSSSSRPVPGPSSNPSTNSSPATGNQVMQFKIKLMRLKPPIWRRIQVPSTYNFWGLHMAIQNSMGWNNGHLHSFEIKNPENGKTVKIESGSGEKDRPCRISEFSEEKIFKGLHVDLSAHYTEGSKCTTKYTYDGWQHEIFLEGIFPAKKGKKYPICITGRRACPWEDCECTPPDYDPVPFDPKKVEFEDPVEALW